MVSLVPLPVFAGHLGSSDISEGFVPKGARRNRVSLKAALPSCHAASKYGLNEEKEGDNALTLYLRQLLCQLSN